MCGGLLTTAMLLSPPKGLPGVRCCLPPDIQWLPCKAELSEIKSEVFNNDTFFSKIDLLWPKRQEGSAIVAKLSKIPLLSRASLLSPTRAVQPSVTEAAL